jgi:hypothetical protein
LEDESKSADDPRSDRGLDTMKEFRLPERELLKPWRVVHCDLKNPVREGDRLGASSNLLAD